MVQTVMELAKQNKGVKDSLTTRVSGDALVLLVGPSGAGKSTFAKKWFAATQIVSADVCRAWISDCDSNQEASADAFELVHLVVTKRLRRGLLTVVDATNLNAEAVTPLLEKAETFKRTVFAYVFTTPLEECLQNNKKRPGRQVTDGVVTRQFKQVAKIATFLANQDMAITKVFGNSHSSSQEVIIRKTRSYTQALVNKEDHGPFDIIGDVHGCYEELLLLLKKLGYAWGQSEPVPRLRHPGNRRVVFVGDLVDRGPNSLGVLALVKQAVADKMSYCVMGNHDDKLRRKLLGNKVQVRHGLETTLAELDQASEQEQQAYLDFLLGIPTYVILAGGKLVVTHAGIAEKDIGKMSDRIKRFCLYGDITGKVNEQGFPLRGNWASSYRGEAAIVYGHTPVAEAAWENNTINIDTGCIFGGRLSALQMPERALVQVPSSQQYDKSIGVPLN